MLMTAAEERTAAAIWRAESAQEISAAAAG